MIRKFLADTVDLLLEALAKLGLLRGGASWWRYRMQQKLGGVSSEAENVKKAIKASHRMCRQCRQLNPARDSHCASCGAPMSGVPRGGAGRAVGMILPTFGSVSLTLVGLNVAIFLAMALLAQGIGTPQYNQMLGYMGAKKTSLILQYGEWWRLINPIFLHGSVMHILFNSYALANLGPLIEEWIGSKRFLVVYVGTGVFSFVASAVLSPASWSVGASGALFGLIGFGVVHGYLHGGGGRYVSQQLMRWAIFGLLLAILPFGLGIDHAAHGGGFVAGALMGWLVSGRPARQPLVERLWSVAAIVSGLLPLAGFVAAFIASRSYF